LTKGSIFPLVQTGRDLRENPYAGLPSPKESLKEMNASLKRETARVAREKAVRNVCTLFSILDLYNTHKQHFGNDFFQKCEIWGLRFGEGTDFKKDLTFSCFYPFKGVLPNALPCRGGPVNTEIVCIFPHVPIEYLS